MGGMATLQILKNGNRKSRKCWMILIITGLLPIMRISMQYNTIHGTKWLVLWKEYFSGMVSRISVEMSLLSLASIFKKHIHIYLTSNKYTYSLVMMACIWILRLNILRTAGSIRKEIWNVILRFRVPASIEMQPDYFLENYSKFMIQSGIRPVRVSPVIVQYIGSLDAGGAERQLCNLVIEARKRNLEIIHLLTKIYYLFN